MLSNSIGTTEAEWSNKPFLLGAIKSIETHYHNIEKETKAKSTPEKKEKFCLQLSRLKGKFLRHLRKCASSREMVFFSYLAAFSTFPFRQRKHPPWKLFTIQMYFVGPHYLFLQNILHQAPRGLNKWFAHPLVIHQKRDLIVNWDDFQSQGA